MKPILSALVLVAVLALAVPAAAQAPPVAVYPGPISYYGIMWKEIPAAVLYRIYLCPTSPCYRTATNQKRQVTTNDGALRAGVGFVVPAETTGYVRVVAERADGTVARDSFTRVIAFDGNGMMTVPFQ